MPLPRVPILAEPRSAVGLRRPEPTRRIRAPPLSLLADRCTSMRELLQVHAQMVVSGRILDNFAASRLLSFCATHPSGDLLHASALLCHTPAPNSFMWNTLIRGHADSPDPSAAVRLYARMRRLGVLPGKHTFPFVLKGCAPTSDAVPLARQLHVHALKYGLDLDPHVGNGLIRCYGCGGMLGDARKVFDGLPDRSLVIWTTMISCYAQNLQPVEALAMFDGMVRVGLEPSDAALASVLSSCARAGDLDQGERIHRYIREKGVEMGVILGTALVDMYAKNGAIAKAQVVFRQLPERNTATWNAMICGLAHHGHADEALELFREAERERVVANDVTFVGVLSACCHAGLVDVGRKVFNSMEMDYGVLPKIQHYGCMVDLLGRCGRLVEAEELLKGMKWDPDVSILGALLTACKKHRNIEIAERVAGKILELEPSNHGVYVVLSNIYAEVGRWAEVAWLRRATKSGKLNKIPGWSCVDDDNGGT